MLQSISISDYKQSPQSILNSLQSQIVIRSVNLNSGIKSSVIKSSRSKRLHSEYNSDLQLSVSSENSKQRSYSMQSNRPTITRQLSHNQSIIDTINKKIVSETKENRFVSINQNEQVSDFNQKNSKEQYTLINLQNKVTILIDENKKLILINEQLMQELEKAKIAYETNNQTVLLQSLQRDTQSLQQTVLQYKKINNQQSQQILELQQILNEREELNIEQKSITNQQLIESQQTNKIFKEQFLQLAQKYLLKCFELEKKQIFEKGWSNKINILLKENENLNQMLQQRLNEQMQLQQQYKQQNEIIIKLEQEIALLQQQHKEQNYIITKKNQDQIQIISDLNKQYEQRNEENKKLNELLQQQEYKWRQSCIEFEKEMKQSYSTKLNFEIKHQVQIISDDYQKSLMNYTQTIAVLQGQMQILQKQNEQLHRVNSQNSNFKEWKHEKQLYFEIIQELQQKVTELTNQLATILNQNSNYVNDYNTQGIQEQFNRLEDCQKYNSKMYKKCQKNFNQKFYV
ncbi:unnamed protein product [Paramecium pentaurelia]|uniref:Uncharacterized protein n=1 Tax=Paramecium pentaurelia TaxID=43138 RepID=A0A8S1UDU4_9CILI|nr:unnamed protein product [Paramecium pentaurelia]